MRLGADSWLFFKVAEKNDEAMLLLKEVECGKHHLIVSVLSFGEIKVVMYRRGKPELAEEVIIFFLSVSFDQTFLFKRKVWLRTLLLFPTLKL